jgi:hypothetical protein
MDTNLIAHRDVDFAEQVGWVYPWLTALSAQGERYEVALASTLAHPDVPMSLARPQQTFRTLARCASSALRSHRSNRLRFRPRPFW